MSAPLVPAPLFTISSEHELREYWWPDGAALMGSAMNAMGEAYHTVMNKALELVLGHKPTAYDAARIQILRAVNNWHCETIVVDGIAIGTIAWTMAGETTYRVEFTLKPDQP